MRVPFPRLRVTSGALLAFLGSCGADSGPPAAPAGSGSVDSPWFREITREVGLAATLVPLADGSFLMPEIMGPGIALFDHDGDRDLDILVPSFPLPAGEKRSAANRLFRQEADGTFQDVTQESGLGHLGFGQGVAIGDVDNDGDPDVYFTNWGPDAFYRNQGDGTFTEVTQEVGLGDEEWSCSAAFADYDGDGHLDLFLVRYLKFDPDKRCTQVNSAPEYCTPQVFPSLVDRLYRNRGDGTFQDVSAEAGIVLAGSGLGVLAVDLSGDGLLDFYVANDAQVNHLWVNQGDGTFVDEAYLRGVGVNRRGMPEASMGVAVGDTDGDGILDVFMTHLAGENNTLFRGTADALFSDMTVPTDLSRFDLPYTGFGCGLVDLEHDGDLDVLVMNGRVRRAEAQAGGSLGPFWNAYAEPNLLLENEDGRFRNASQKGGTLTELREVSRGLAFGDLDGDGDLDCVQANVGGAVRVFRNERGEGHWLRVEPRVRGRVASGAIVVVRAGGRARVAVATRASSFASSNDPAAHFGLGESTAYEELEVRWPDGSREGFAGGAVDRSIVVIRGRGEQR